MSRKLLILGFWLGLSTFAAANIYSYYQALPPCCDLTTEFGFPFSLGTYGGYFRLTSLHFLGLLIDGTIAIASSMAIGRLFVKLIPVLTRFLTSARAWHVRTRL